MVYTFDDAKAPTRHATQYFEITANRGLYQDGWMASTTPQRLPWQVSGVAPDPDDYPWELFDVSEISAKPRMWRRRSRRSFKTRSAFPD